MLLTIDVGNTQIVLGMYTADAGLETAEDGLAATWRVSTVSERTEDELGIMIQGLLAGYGWSWNEAITGVAVSSGVPRVTTTIRRMVERYFDFEPIVLGPGVKTGLSILYDNPREVGADRIANGVGAFDLFGGPSIVVDFGTGTTFDAISAAGEYMGGAIAPGVEVSMDALSGRASALAAIELVEPRSVIGKSTVESLQSGALYGFAGQVDGIVERMVESMGQSTVLATGGLAGLIAPYTKSIEHVEPWLTLHGLRLIWQRNQ